MFNSKICVFLTIAVYSCSAFTTLSLPKVSTHHQSALFYKNEDTTTLESLIVKPKISTTVNNGKTTATEKKKRKSFLSEAIDSLKSNTMKSWEKLSQKGKDDVKQWFIERGEKNGVPFISSIEYFQSKFPNIQENYNTLVDNDLVYPEYYTQTFHGYEDGNLNWASAEDCLPATISIPLSYWPKENPVETTEWYRGNYTQSMKQFTTQLSNDSSSSMDPKKDQLQILDIGGSIGASTHALLNAFPKSHVSLIDASPYFLSAAKTFLTEKDSPLYVKGADQRVTYHHGLAEKTEFEDNSFDVISISFVIHELPTHVVGQILQECSRLLKSGGVISILDLDGNIVMNLPPLRRYLFEISEPHVGEYTKKTNVLNMLKEHDQFTLSMKKMNDPMNAHWMARKV